MGILAPGSGWQRSKRHPGLITWWPEMWKKMSEAAQRKEQQKWAVEQPKLDDAGSLRGSFFIDPAYEELKETIQNARRKLEVPMAAAMPCKIIRGGNTGKLVALLMLARQTHTSLKPMNLRESVWKALYTKIMKTILQGKELIHWLNHYNLVQSLIQCLKRWKNQMRKQQRLKNGKTRESTGMAADESQKPKRGDRWSKERRKNSTRCVVNGHLLSQEFGVGATISKIPRPSGTPRWHCKRWIRITRNIYWTRIITITNDSRKKSWTLFQDYQDAQDKQQMQHPLTPRSKWKMHRRYWKFPSQNVQIFGFVYQNTNGLNQGPAWKTQSFFLSANSTVILWQHC